jgi:hypothetical chaperone protein
MHPVSLGIDFGTSNTVIAVVDSASAAHILNVHCGELVGRTLPSILCFKPDEQRPQERPVSFAGASAIDEYVRRAGPARLVQSMKSFLGSRSFVDTRVFAHTYTLEQLVGELLTHLYEATRSRAMLAASPLVIGRPIHFAGAFPDDSLAQTRLVEAFRIAGRAPNQVRLEPEAAAYAFANRAAGRHIVLVADLGGGTSDFSVAMIEDGANRRRITPLAQTGVGIAGDRFDYHIVFRAVCSALGMGASFRPETQWLPVPLWLYANFASWHQLSMMKTRQVLRQIDDILQTTDSPAAIAGLAHVIRNEEGFSLFQAVAGLKQVLSRQDRAQLRFQAGPITIDRTVHREEFEDWIGEDLAQIMESADSALRKANLTPHEITRVFMTGGSSLVPAVRAAFARKFGNEKLVGGDEFASVAQGLAMMGLDG